MVYNSQKGYGLKDLSRNLTRPFKPLLKPVLEGVKDVGIGLAGDLIGDLISGKTSKASIKERGKQAKNMAVQRTLQNFQGGSGNFSPASLGWSDKTAKRKRSRSKSQPPAKRKRSQSKSTKRKHVQSGGIYPPIHYPAGNYPDYNRIMKGGGLFDFSSLIKKFDKERIADCKDWLKRQQKGGRRPVKKRKPRKQTGAGKKRKPRKQTGAGKKRKPRKQTGKKSKSRKQTGGCINPNFIRRQTGGSSWANDVMSDVM